MSLLSRTIRGGFAILIALSLALAPADACASVAKLKRDPSHNCCPHKAKPAIPDLTSPDCHCSISQSVPAPVAANDGEITVPAVTIGRTWPGRDVQTVVSFVSAEKLYSPQFRYIAFHQLLI